MFTSNAVEGYAAASSSIRPHSSQRTAHQKQVNRLEMEFAQQQKTFQPDLLKPAQPSQLSTLASAFNMGVKRQHMSAKASPQSR